VAQIEKTLNIFSVLVMLLLFNSCANQLSPPGGEIDRTPPKIVESIPKDRTVNFKGRSFEVTFSEYVNKNNIRDNVFISPKIQGEPEYSWSGKTLEVIFPDSLKKNTTYSVTLSAGIMDLNNSNKMGEAYSFYFSTGPVIDSGKISGKVYDKEPSGIMVFAYKDKGAKTDVTKDQPDYISQAGQNGNFQLTGLGLGDYLVFALRDKFQDFIINDGVDPVGVPSAPVTLTKDSTHHQDVDFFVALDDTVKPHLNKVVMTDRNHIAVEFSKAVDSTKLAPENFQLIDSLAHETIPMRYFYKGQGKTFQFFLSFAADTVKNPKQLCFAVSNLIDTKGNKLAYERATIVYNPRADTSAAKIFKMSGQYQGDLLDYETPEIFVQFDHGFEKSVPPEAVSVVDAKDKTLKIKIENLDNSSFKIGFDEKLKPKSEMTLKLDLKKFKDISGKSLDSLYKKKFTIINDLDFSGASGNVAAGDTSKEVYVVLEKADREKKVYHQKTTKKGDFDIKKVVPGKYLLWSFIDSDGNKSYSKGKVNPLIFSEKFKYYPDTLNLRARWPVGDIKIQFDKK
jgi:hypothetical protein